MNTCIQSKSWLKFVLPLLKYTSFSKGLFSIGAPCMHTHIYIYIHIYTVHTYIHTADKAMAACY